MLPWRRSHLSYFSSLKILACVHGQRRRSGAACARQTKKHKKAKEKSTEYIRLGELENSLRKIQNSKEPPSIERITKIQKIKAEIKAEAARIRPAGPKLARPNRYEREEECTTQFFRKFRTKH